MGEILVKCALACSRKGMRLIFLKLDVGDALIIDGITEAINASMENMADQINIRRGGWRFL